MPPVLVVEDRDSLRVMLRSALEAEGFSVEEAADGARAITALGTGRYLAVVTELKLPGTGGHKVLAAAREADPNLPVIVMIAHGSIDDAVGAITGGAFDFLPKPVDPDHLMLLLRRAAERTALLEENLLLKAEFAERLGFPRIIGESPALAEVSRQIQSVAPTDACVLIEGEAGTGKDLFARAIHHLSPRRDAPFVTISCATIPEALLEADLFGREKGVHAGAAGARPGRMELADRGTLFLEEIGDLGLGVQAKLVRLLEERTFERVGGTRTLSVNLRVVAATQRDLSRAAGRGAFREDLHSRLAATTLKVPPLRDRRGDVPSLATHFLERFRRELGRQQIAFSDAASRVLRGHDWPGNIRELANCIERAVLLAEGNRIEPHHLGLESGTRAGDEIDDLCRTIMADGPLEEVGSRARDVAERVAIRRALGRAEGNRVRAARLLDVGQKRLLSRIRELGIDEDPPA